jgi:hypothetical protein
MAVVKLDKAGVGRLLRSNEIKEATAAAATRLQSAIGEGWELSSPIYHQNRVIYEVSTMDPKAHYSEAESGRIATIVKGLNV